jgi:hypothetical protein
MTGGPDRAAVKLRSAVLVRLAVAQCL